MRFYVFTPGQPGYISAEVAVRDLKGADEARGWAADEWAHNGRRIISRSEALMRPAYRTALKAWERHDDDLMQTTEVAQIRSEVRPSNAHRCRRQDSLRSSEVRGRTPGHTDAGLRVEIPPASPTGSG